VTPAAQSILSYARVAELHRQADELAAVVRPSPMVQVARPSSRRGRHDHRRLLLLLAHERRRNAHLIAELVK
jgi:hypothetical protein